jgi:polyhydroxyalkanoate synthesis regulator phasin
MAERGSTRLFLDAVEELFAELPSRARGGKEKLSESATGVLRALADELDLVRREDLEELELRVAQLEHRLRLLEGPRDLPPAA